MNAELSENDKSQSFYLASEQNGRLEDEQRAARMNTEQEHHPHLHLFTLRVWEETLGAGNAEWRGRVQDVISGKTLFFRDWPGLITTLQRLIAETACPPDPRPGGSFYTHEIDE